MSYNTDQPIDKVEQDLLGRSTFSIQLAKSIYEYNKQSGLVIGLFGKWGTGKTSVINMVKKEISRLDEKNKKDPLIMNFSPWNYSDKDNLISLFFQKLINEMEINENEEIKNKVGKALKDYAGAFDALSIIPVIGSGVAALLKTLAQVQGNNLIQVPDLDMTRKTLEKELIRVNKKIIIIIDDIDRLSNSQIRDIFQLVKQVADFPNVVYMLAMDRTVVCSALAEVHNIDGNEYLEKIIQIPFELPELRKDKLYNILFDKLEKIIDDLPNKVMIDKNYWDIVFTNCIRPYINTLRDINRLLNVFHFRYGMLYQETSFADMVGITTLEVLEPKLYKWICNNKDAVCVGLRSLASRDNTTDYRKLYHDEFKNIGIDPDIAISCISTMFPMFAKDVGLYQIGQATDIRRDMRVAYSNRFELYFMFDLDDVNISRKIITDCLFEHDKKALCEVIRKINKEGNIIYFLEETQSLVDKIPYERLFLIASVMFDLHGEFESLKKSNILFISSIDIAQSIIKRIIIKLNTEEEKYKIIRYAIDNVNAKGLATISKIIIVIEKSYGRLESDSENKDNQIISLEHMKELEKIYLEKIETITRKNLISDISRFYLAFYLWEYLDKNGVSKFLKRFFENEANKLKFICSMASGWYGSNGVGWSFDSNRYGKYISQEEVYKIIKNLDKNKLDEFTEIEQIKLASFVCNYDKSETEHVNEQEAQKIVNQWKKVEAS